MIGKIIKAIAGFYYVKVGNEVYECKARGSFKNNSVNILVGDEAEISLTAKNTGVIENVLERKNYLLRPTVANIDKLFIVSSYNCPSPNTVIIDKLIALSIFKNITPVIVFNKCDEGDFSEFYKIYSSCGFDTYVVSAKTGENIDLLKNELINSTCAFTGNSGVGKSSLINALMPEFSLAVGDVSRKLGRGKHTTRHVELFQNDFGGFIFDTPGFATIEIDEDIISFKDNLHLLFPEFSKHIGECKFADCTHTCEKGCAIISAVNNGEIPVSRFESYKHIFNELKEIKSWQITKK